MNPALPFLFLVLVKIASAQTHSPALVGWGNLFVPGAGATLRGQSVRGLTEAATEIGLFYGGTYGVREGVFTIDTTILTPQRGSLTQPFIGLTMQQLGLKLHMYNSFYHYQQVILSNEEQGVMDISGQPLYRGSVWDVLGAPFTYKTMSSPFVYGAVLAASAYLFYDYHVTPVKKATFKVSPIDNVLYGTYNMGVEPLGSAFGEEPLFRGFMQREFRKYTGSLPLSILMQTALFTLLHPSSEKLSAFGGGLYFGFLIDHFDGNLEQAIATHFWVNTIDGLVRFLAFLRSQNQNTPFGPPISIEIGIPL